MKGLKQHGRSCTRNRPWKFDSTETSVITIPYDMIGGNEQNNQCYVGIVVQMNIGKLESRRTKVFLSMDKSITSEGMLV